MKIWVIISVNYNKGTDAASLQKMNRQYDINWHDYMPEETYPILNCFPAIYKSENEAKWAILNSHMTYEKDKIELHAFPLDINLFHGEPWTKRIYFYAKYEVNGCLTSVSTSNEAYPKDNDVFDKIHFMSVNDVFAHYDKVYETYGEDRMITHHFKDKIHQRKYKLLYVEMPENEIQNIGWVR